MISVTSQLYDWLGFNKSLFLLINHIHAPLLDQAMLLASWLGDPSLFPCYMTAALLLTWRQPSILPLQNVLVFSMSYLLTSALLVPTLKALLDFPRPITVLGEQAVIVLGNPDGHHSFPSGHAAFAVLLALSLSPGIFRGGQLALVIFALLVCLSRISLGAHFPADILGGAAISILVASSGRYLLNTVSKHRTTCGCDKDP